MSSNSYSTIKDRISEACDAIHDGWYSNSIEEVKIHKVLLRCLQRQWNGRALKGTQVATNKVLTEAWEGVICKYIDCLNKFNMYSQPKMILEASNYLICFVVGHQWLKPFFKWNLRYYVCKKKLLAADQKNSNSIYNISTCFNWIE